MLILIRKFNFVKKLKLVLKTENNNNDEENNTNTNIFNFLSNNFINNSGYSNDSYLDKTDVQNTILVFLNLEWLFPNVVEIDVDLTCPELTDYLVNNIYSTYLKIFSKIFKKDIKLNILPNNSKNNNRNYDPVQKFLYTNVSTTYSHIYDEEHSSDKFSTSMLSNNLNISTSIGQINNNNNSINQSMNNININTSFQSLETLNQKKMDLFFKKYSSFLEMIIIYGYFIQKKLSKAIKFKFILPQNLCDEIVKLLKKQKVIIENYHFFSFINNQNILHTTIDFNALDNQTFEKVLNFLNKNQLINNCNISFFPPEECFKSELLLKTLQNTDENYKIKINKYGIFDFNSNFLIKDIYPSEDINTYILRKLSKYFEKNLTDFFNILTIKTGIADLSLYFDLPQILINNGLYNNILIKFFMNLFIFINNSLNNIKTLLISADNVIIDERQHPILDQFFNELNFNDSNQEFKLLNLCFNAKMYYIKNIYKLLSKDLIYLSIGAFDYVTFNSFVDFFCSKNFRQKSNLINLKISLNNSAFDVNYVYDNIIKLFTQFPNQMVEINLTTSLIISYEQIEKTGSVSIVDNKEQAGTASIYNNILKENINPWLNSSKTSNISFNANNDITSYLAMLKTSMSIVRVSETDLTGNTSQQINFENEGARNASESFIKYLTALRTKPFMLLAGISGTGKSRIVRKLAQASVTEDLQRLYDPKSLDGGFNRWKLHKPANFELIQVKPNWHNSLEVVGYKSNIGGVHYEFTPFVEFVARAWKHPEVPFFLCLDEMNLAPVEQYFAEFLSAIESRSFENNVYETDPIVKPFVEFGDDLWIPMVNHLLGDINASDATSDSPIAKLVDRFKTKGLTLPQNLLVMGTVNMDETTFSFSRKVLDRAMSVVMNTVEYKDFFNGESENDVAEMSNDFIDWLINRPIRGLETQDNKAEEVEIYLTSINNVLEDTPFKLGYRAANEALLYVSAAHKFNPSIDLNSALDDFTLMKILSRIEGDKRSIGGLLVELQNVITNDYPKSNKKLIKMAETLANKQFVSYWT